MKSAVITDNLDARRAKLNRVAKDIRHATQLADILASFPENMRDELLAEITTQLRFELPEPEKTVEVVAVKAAVKKAKRK